MIKAVFIAALLSLAGAAAFAQGTTAQRAACERDSHKFCAAAEPDALAVDDCLKRRMSALSSACRKQFRARR
jgi:hypothetical protein